MNIIVFKKGGGAPIRLNLGAGRLRRIAVAAGAAVLAIGMLGFWMGQAFSVTDRQAVADLAALSEMISQQQTELAEIRDHGEDHLLALSLKLGELQARSMRIEAVGDRLTQLGQLDDGEFDFSAAPPVGGPGQAPEITYAAGGGLVDLNDELDRFESRLAEQSRQIRVLERLIADRELEKGLQPAGIPIENGWVSSLYGKRVDPFTGNVSHHAGIDIAGPLNAEVLAVAGGVVTWSGKQPDYGLTVEIDHGNGYRTRYGHNQKNLVNVGERVKAGDAVAIMGSSGRATGAHVHFEVFLNGRRIDPTGVAHAMR
ncbi:MAG: M23 family metallopeptidase [Xanthomonadales bacterium]|nr:M23 family metallopeptidase [Xanthomonadales bacterium]